MAEAGATLGPCPTCGADWEAGAWSTACGTCDGGAMSRPCPQCGGRCGEAWLRLPDTASGTTAYRWVGTCRLLDGSLT